MALDRTGQLNPRALPTGQGPQVDQVTQPVVQQTTTPRDTSLVAATPPNRQARAAVTGQSNPTPALADPAATRTPGVAPGTTPGATPPGQQPADSGFKNAMESLGRVLDNPMVKGGAALGGVLAYAAGIPVLGNIASLFMAAWHLFKFAGSAMNGDIRGMDAFKGAMHLAAGLSFGLPLLSPAAFAIDMALPSTFDELFQDRSRGFNRGVQAGRVASNDQPANAQVAVAPTPEPLPALS